MSGTEAASSRREAPRLMGAIAVIAVVAVAILMTVFATVDSTARPFTGADTAIGGKGPTPGGDWRAVRGDWTIGPDGAAVDRPGPQLSALVHPVGGTEGTLRVTGTPQVDGWSIVFRWQGPGTYGLVTFTPSQSRVDIVSVVSDRTRSVATAPLEASALEGVDGVEVELTGPIVRVFLGDTLLVAGRADALRGGASAGVALVGESGAAEARFVDLVTTAPAAPAPLRMEADR